MVPIILLTLTLLIKNNVSVEGFAFHPPSTPSTASRLNFILAQSLETKFSAKSMRQISLNARGRGFDDDEDDDDELDRERELVGATRRSEAEMNSGGRGGKSASRRFQDNVDFFDLDDDDDDFEDEFDDEFGRREYGETYNGIIPNPLLDAMDPDGVYERLGPELFKDWTFWRDMVLFAIFLTLFTGDTHRYGTFDSVVEGMERLPADFIK
mmetsp:Transcript_4279/g.9528  ORF Transcript_4279/g.9528 Transcript_4279/m.9528 type:complete len:211 (-) Transcript_4279:164-796(-)|eukprot:CAMPEP_0171341572 /NCGR_PEP_ID=MMETSP0878-20121228/10868_1 /TAXON_ID=67004 /ORGANISM="Thalassiosira weissflogii, Strain CCMP1336" /LENGTH=210 /DNA_ID=CAMNT_0011843881 /DNA_START=100 /DNA_END=732 /DNA_ORIENTATION=-